MIKNLSDYVLVDLETTGLDNSDEIIEIGALRVVNHKITQSFSTLCKPHKLIPQDATEVHHITNEMVTNSPDITKVMSAFCDFIKEDDILMGHNISTFDIKYLERDAKTYLDTEMKNKLYDTLYVSRREMKFLKSHSLKGLSDYYGIDYSKAHRAVEDCFINYQVYEKMIHDDFTTMNKICPQCQHILKLTSGKYGWFWSCSNDLCNHTENFIYPNL